MSLLSRVMQLQHCVVVGQVEKRTVCRVLVGLRKAPTCPKDPKLHGFEAT